MLLGLTVGLVAAEAIFWVRDDGAFPHVNLYRPDPVLGVRLVPGSEQRLAFGGNPVTHLRINRDGYRGADLPPPAADEVLVVGDSQVFGLGVEEDQTFSARLAAARKGGVVNGGVPTYGPAEYKAVVAEMLAKRHPKTVVFTINMVNDLFEAAHPNVERHAVWDGWAVRAESGPGGVTWFPGRHFLFNRSHAFFALRRLWHRRDAGPESGFTSEGTWEDIAGAGYDATAKHDEAERRIRERHAEIGQAETRLAAAEDQLDEATRKVFPDERFGENGNKLQAARANPGDIIEDAIADAEASRSIVVTAELIRQGAAYRARLLADVRARAQHGGDEKLLAAFADRERLQAQLTQLDAQAPVHLESSLAPVLREVKALCDAGGARLVVLVLPIDVQVSTDEWKKYDNAPKVDMESTKVLIADVVADAAALGVTVVDALPVLAAVEPGAFLNRDIHMTSRGHQAVADALAKALASPPPAPRSPSLPAGRSTVPLAAAWKAAPEVRVTGSTRAGCETKRIREWLRVACRRYEDTHTVPAGYEVSDWLWPLDVTVVRDPRGEAMTLAMPAATTLVAPVLEGDELVVDFGWIKHSQRLEVRWPKGAAEPTMAFGERVKRKPPRAYVYEPATPTEAAICTCWKTEHHEQSCNGAFGAADAACVKTYAGDCAALLACIVRDPGSPPKGR